MAAAYMSVGFAAHADALPARASESTADFVARLRDSATSLRASCLVSSIATLAWLTCACFIAPALESKDNVKGCQRQLYYLMLRVRVVLAARRTRCPSSVKAEGEARGAPDKGTAVGNLGR
jgi:hypothetical protein